MAALFLGGTEKIAGGELASEAEALYGLPVVFDSEQTRGLDRVISLYRPEVVVDLSDEPVLGYVERFRLISHSLARNVIYVGSDFQFSPPAALPSMLLPLSLHHRNGEASGEDGAQRVCRSDLAGDVPGARKKGLRVWS